MPREQDQFLEVVDRDTAERRWWEAIRPEPLGAEVVPLARRWGGCLPWTSWPTWTCRRSTARTSTAMRSGPRRRIGASEEAPRRLEVNPEEIATGTRAVAVRGRPARRRAIATGGMLPRGADSVLMVEHARVEADRLIVTRPVAPGANVSFAGTDMARGELVLRRGTRLTARETGVLAAIGRGEVAVVRRPRVAILSTGDEIIAPGTPATPCRGPRRQCDPAGRRRARAGGRAVAPGDRRRRRARRSTRRSSAGWTPPTSSC